MLTMECNNNTARPAPKVPEGYFLAPDGDLFQLRPVRNIWMQAVKRWVWGRTTYEVNLRFVGDEESWTWEAGSRAEAAVMRDELIRQAIPETAKPPTDDDLKRTEDRLGQMTEVAVSLLRTLKNTGQYATEVEAIYRKYPELT